LTEIVRRSLRPRQNGAFYLGPVGFCGPTSSNGVCWYPINLLVWLLVCAAFRCSEADEVPTDGLKR